MWSVSFPAGTCKINHGTTTCYTTSSPVVDPARKFVYTYGLDGKVHKVTLATGVEVTDAHWPVVATLKPWDEKGSSSLAEASTAGGHTYLYVTNSGYPGDNGDYQGHVTTIDLATGTSTVFNTLCSDQTVHFAPAPATPDCAQVTSGVWARVGVTYSAATGLTYLVTGNATFDPTNHHWGDTVLAIHPDGTGVSGGPVDSFTPTNYAQLDSLDEDLGSTAPAVVPAPAGSVTQTGNPITALGVQGGKGQVLYLLDLGDLSGDGGPGHTGGALEQLPVPQGGLVYAQPTVWTNPGDGLTWVFVGTANGLSAFTITLHGTTPQLTLMWKNSVVSNTPFIANGLLYTVGGGSTSATLGAYDPVTGASRWTTTVGGTHWQSPVVDGGKVLLEDNTGHLTAWGP